MTEFTVSRRRFNTLLGTGIVGGLAMPSLALGQSAREIRLAHHTALESEQQLTAEVFARKVAEYSGGSLKVTILPAAQMGGHATERAASTPAMCRNSASSPCPTSTRILTTGSGWSMAR